MEMPALVEIFTRPTTMTPVAWRRTQATTLQPAAVFPHSVHHVTVVATAVSCGRCSMAGGAIGRCAPSATAAAAAGTVAACAARPA